jgi:aryl-alcohol dehydrogenase-like predicted oxidoreductase
MTDRLVLGTVQLGMPYGINNKFGKPNFDSACDIVQTAFEQGIARFDTAQAYGDSEEVLGRIFDSLGLTSNVKVFSKLDPKLDLLDDLLVRQSVDESLRRLKVDHLEGLFLHREEGLDLWESGLRFTLEDLVKQGKVRTVGASFYTPSKAFAALDIDGIDFLQIPSNILDHRFEDAGVFEKARERNKKIFVRSVFLQGLLLMPLDRVPPSMAYTLPYLERVVQTASDMKLSRQELALGYAAQRWPASFILFGAENRAQIMENSRVFYSKSAFIVDENVFKDVPDNVLNPTLWPNERHS